MIAKAKYSEEQKKNNLEKQKRLLDAKWLPKYDLNGNGRLDPDERTRAEKDSKAGIQAPAQE